MSGGPDEFLDMMPHRLTVKGAVILDDYGYPIGEADNVIYACLLDDDVKVEYPLSGARVMTGHVAYVNPYPILPSGEFALTPAIITQNSIIWTSDDDKHEVLSVATHYSEDGLPHNQEVRYN